MENERKWTQTATISKTYERACAENLGISRNFIRNACIDGRLKHCRVGNNKILIFWPNLLAFIQNGDNAEKEPIKINPSEIKPIPEKLHRVRFSLR